VAVSADYGASWRKAKLDKPKNKYDWQRWSATVKLPSDGYYEIWARATDARGMMQPHVAGNWNPQGYGANPMHRIAVLLGCWPHRFLAPRPGATFGTRQEPPSASPIAFMAWHARPIPHAWSKHQ
jgi:hypothetical protein